MSALRTVASWPVGKWGPYNDTFHARELTFPPIGIRDSSRKTGRGGMGETGQSVFSPVCTLILDEVCRNNCLELIVLSEPGCKLVPKVPKCCTQLTSFTQATLTLRWISSENATGGRVVPARSPTCIGRPSASLH